LAQQPSSDAQAVSNSPEQADVRLASKLNQHADASTQSLLASSAQSKATELASSQAEIRFQRQVLLTEGAHQSSAPIEVQASGMGDSLIRPAERTAAKSGAGNGSANGDASWGYLALRDAGRKDAAAPASETVSVSSDWQVAQTVNYWVTQGVQNAELKLDGFGGQAVEVSISLKGDQAQVGFRTDQPEIRQMLEGAVAQLKDLLSNQGLVLSGVSVGNSAQQGPAQQERRNFQGVRQTAIATVDAVAEPLRVRLAGTTGRSVDLFV
jgi:flagellar hook-length control protein FliK